MNSLNLKTIKQHPGLKNYYGPIMMIIAISAVSIIVRVNQAGVFDSAEDLRAENVEAGEGPFLLEHVQELFPETDHLIDTNEPGYYKVKDSDHQLLGALVYGPLPGEEIIGYAGKVPFLAAIDPDQRIKQVFMLPSRETPQYARMVSEKLADAWNKLSPAEAREKSVDTVSGATQTSQALVRGVKARMEQISPETAPMEIKEDFANGIIIRNLFVIWFLIIALGCFSFPAILNPRIRNGLRILSVSIPGMVAATMLSVSLFAGWIHGALSWESHWLLLAVAILAVAIPLLQGKNYYCHFFCPFGAAQDLVANINKKRKLRLNKRMISALRTVRILLLLFALIVVLGELRFDLSMLEPFSAFRWRHASSMSRILAVSFLISAIWLPRAWCRICPTGGLIAAMKRTGKANQD